MTGILKSNINFAMLILAMGLIFMASCATSKRAATMPEQLPGLHITFTGDQVADTVFVRVSPIPVNTALSVKDYVENMDNGKQKAYAVKSCFKPCLMHDS